MAFSHTISIRDGYDEEGYIAEAPRLYPALRFKFRPMLAERRDTITREFSKKTPAQFHQLMAAEIASRMLNWDAVGDKGQTMPINAASIRTLRPKLFDRLYNIVSGDEPGDPDPLADDAAANEGGELLLEAAVGDTTVGGARELRDVGNSGEG